MAGHFGSIGFAVATREELEALAVLAASVGEARDEDGRTLVRWEAGSGVEVWTEAVRGEKKIRSVTPYFASGRSVLEGTVEAASERQLVLVPKGSALAGVSIALVEPASGLERGATVRLSVAAFAHAFDEELGEGGLAPGMMVPGGKGLTIAAGRIVSSEKRTNPSGRRDFVWALVSVQGGTLDVLLDPDLRDEPLEAGECRGVFWLAGRILRA